MRGSRHRPFRQNERREAARAGPEWAFEGVSFELIAASDVATRDGFGYELWELGASGRGWVLEAFWDDSTGQFTFTALTAEPLPFRLVEQFVESAAAGVPLG